MAKKPSKPQPKAAAGKSGATAPATGRGKSAPKTGSASPKPAPKR